MKILPVTLGAAMLRFCEHPEIPALLRAQPELIPKAVEELLRLDGSFICIGRTARHNAEIDGHQVKEGERVITTTAHQLLPRHRAGILGVRR
jgi:cytochrome P450